MSYMLTCLNCTAGRLETPMLFESVQIYCQHSNTWSNDGEYDSHLICQCQIGYYFIYDCWKYDWKTCLISAPQLH